ncbi:MAG TPA: Rrf2 family transcriptional regulator [Ktedonobacteraceae bacterium]|jgi:Rrf2 family nitric oxide-sensitive transcriptional repressor|nr:Rrf2 family transcriptional regulator [Ktedonobacteraceae bacterium]
MEYDHWHSSIETGNKGKTMRLTYQADYSLRVLLYLAASPEDRLANIQDIADTYKISHNHLMKVVYKLGKLGYIETVRGHGGGMRLAKGADEISIGAIVRQMEEDFRVVECFAPEHNQCVITPICQLRPALHEALEAFLQVLDRYTLADVTTNKELYKQFIVPFA